MAGGAAEIGELRRPGRGGVAPGGIVRHDFLRHRQRCLKGDERGDVAGRKLVRVAVLVEIVGAGPARPEALARFHAVMRVQGVDGELAKRDEDALLAERPDGQVGVDALDAGIVDAAVRR